jgi:DNA-binding LacI/PurR family transcriptional regulator
MAQRSGGRVTSTDVARAAGVSRATVSYVINSAPNESISKDTRRRVLDAADKLGYTAYGPARTLASGRSDVVLLVMQNRPLGHHLSTLLDTIDLELAAHGLSLVIHRIVRPHEPIGAAWKTIGPCGVIGIETFSRADTTAMRKAGIVVVRTTLEVGDGKPEPGVFVMSQSGFAQTQVGHLVSRGHTRLGFAYPASPRLAAYAKLRLAGVRRAAASLGLPEVSVQTFEPSIPGATGALDAWRHQRSGPTAICSYNDEMALAVLAAARVRGVRVPEDLAVIGIDDDPAGRLSSPSLSTMDRDWVEFARNISASLVGPLNGKAAPVLGQPLSINLIVRESAP